MFMKKLLLGVLFAVSLTAMLEDAQARPAGGGRSIGRQSQNVTRQAPAPSQAAPRPAAAPAATPAATPPKPASPWKGILGGALLGLGMGALFSHLGLGGAMGGMLGSILMIGLLAVAGVFIFRMLQKKKDGQAAPFQSGFGAPTPQPAASGIDIGSGLQPRAAEPLQALQPSPFGAAPTASSAPSLNAVTLDKTATPWGVPANFDIDALLRYAKTGFIRLQAAWDKGDIADIRDFTTTEMYAELKLQIQERAAADFTDVVTIDAVLLGMETTATDYLASVQFAGTIRSAPNAAPEPFGEVWNLSKPLTGADTWLLAGIQQVA